MCETTERTDGDRRLTTRSRHGQSMESTFSAHNGQCALPCIPRASNNASDTRLQYLLDARGPGKEQMERHFPQRWSPSRRPSRPRPPFKTLVQPRQRSIAHLRDALSPLHCNSTSRLDSGWETSLLEREGDRGVENPINDGLGITNSPHRELRCTTCLQNTRLHTNAESSAGV